MPYKDPAKKRIHEKMRSNLDGYQMRRPRDRRRDEQLKKSIFTIYGHGKCACVHCGEKRLDCLSIDHVNNDGAKDKLSGDRLYRYLRDNNYPLGFQTLCMNCQFLKLREFQRHLLDLKDKIWQNLVH